jgi:hypothetical protein
MTVLTVIATVATQITPVLPDVAPIVPHVGAVVVPVALLRNCSGGDDCRPHRCEKDQSTHVHSP